MSGHTLGAESEQLAQLFLAEACSSAVYADIVREMFL